MEMKLVLLFLIISLSSYAQEGIEDSLKVLDANNQPQLIIERYGKNIKKYSAQSLFYLGKAYYLTENDKKCVELMNLHIKKGSAILQAYFYKGKSLYFLEEYKEAIKTFEKALKINPLDAPCYAALGDVYLDLKETDKALTAYEKAIENETVLERPYAILGMLYMAKGNEKKALESYYTAKDKVDKEGSVYIRILYNIGLIELLDKKYEKAELAYKELLEIAPSDYESYSKLIQICYGKKEYEKAIPYKEKLYEAYEKGELTEHMKEMFCFDQFKWKDKNIQVYERFASPEGQLYYKHLFYVVNKEGKIELRIQTENSTMSVAMGGPKYLLGRDEEGTHSTFGVGFNEDLDYEELKKAVLGVLNGEIKPMASSRMGK